MKFVILHFLIKGETHSNKIKLINFILMKSTYFFVLTLFFLFFAVPLVNGQDGSSSDGIALNYGIKAGLVSSDFQKLESTESRTAYSAGLFVDYKITDLLGISVEALYVQEGTMRMNPDYIYYNGSMTTNESFTIEKVNSNIIMHNFEAPLLINFYLGQSNFNPKVFVGGSFDYIYNVYAKNLLSYSSETDTYVISDRSLDVVTSSFKEYNVGAVIGAGISYEFLTLDIRYKFGVMDVNNLATFNYQNSYKEDFSTNVLMVSVGMNINKLF